MVNYWQDAAENFYPERADFTSSNPGGKLADHLTTSDPIIMRRELANQFSVMLRPRGIDWAKMTVEDDDDLDEESLGWLEDRTERQRRIFYDSTTGAVQATKQGDNDYVTFGQCVLKVERNYKDYALLVRCKHLRDVAWSDDFTGRTDTVHEKWKPSAWELSQIFRKDKLHKNVLLALEKDPDKEFECRHIVIPSEKLGKKDKFPFRCVYVDVENQHEIESVESETLKYVIPRWQTVSGSQYSYSQATLAALPDSRLLQAVTLTILEAGEKYVSPPMIAVQEALRGDLNLFANGVTYVDEKYDERLGEVLRPITQDKGGFQAGIEILDRVRMALREAFFLNRLSLPQLPGDATATQVMQIVQDNARANLPLFEPVEHNYNAPLCEMMFTEAMGMGFMGRKDEIPDGLKGRNMQFKFVSPLQEAEDRKNAALLVQTATLVNAVAPFDPSLMSMPNWRKALRESLRGVGDPIDWIKSDEEMDEMVEEMNQKKQMQETMGMVQQGAEIAETGSKAAANIAQV